MLSTSLAKLEGGELSIAEFSQRFTSSRWEAVMASNSALLHLGWDIQNILYEWMAFPDLIAREQIALQIREAIAENGVMVPEPVTQGAPPSR